MDYCSDVKKKERNNAICSNMDGLRDMSEVKSEKDRYYMLSLICGTFYFSKIQMYLISKEK